MGKVDRLRNKAEPFAALFWALGIVFANTWSRQLSCPPPGIVGSILNERRAGPTPLFSYLGLLLIYVGS